MPRPKEYSSNAEKQAAYRARHAHKKPPRADDVMALARTLRGSIADAARRGDSLAQELEADRIDDALRNLIREFERRQSTSEFVEKL
jgi:hypothetical protein